jgi:hypothetical protein
MIFLIFSERNLEYGRKLQYNKETSFDFELKIICYY